MLRHIASPLRLRSGRLHDLDRNLSEEILLANFDAKMTQDRVRGGAARLQKNAKSAQQSRLDGFFKPVQRTAEEQEKLKRKNEEKVVAQKKAKKDAAKEKAKAKAKPRGTGG